MTKILKRRLYKEELNKINYLDKKGELEELINFFNLNKRINYF